MQIIRRFKKMNIWDFIDLMNQECFGSAKSDTYFLYLDEIKLRRLESVSEGGDLKLRSLAKELLEEYKKEMEKNDQFSSQEDYESFHYIVTHEI